MRSVILIAGLAAVGEELGFVELDIPYAFIQAVAGGDGLNGSRYSKYVNWERMMQFRRQIEILSDTYGVNTEFSQAFTLLKAQNVGPNPIPEGPPPHQLDHCVAWETSSFPHLMEQTKNPLNQRLSASNPLPLISVPFLFIRAAPPVPGISRRGARG